MVRWKTAAVSLIALLGGLPGLQAAGEQSAFFARLLVGSRSWARVVRITNERPTPRYPADFHATVFELEGMLWFYTETDGTQGLSREARRLVRDREEYRELVRALWPGFVRVEDVSNEEPPIRALINNTLPRGCFLYCLLNWWQLESGLRGVRSGRMLTFYFESDGPPRGHSVLIYRSGNRLAVYDPAGNELQRWIDDAPSGDPLELATWLAPRLGHLTPVAASFLEMHRRGRHVREPKLTVREGAGFSRVSAAR